MTESESSGDVAIARSEYSTPGANRRVRRADDNKNKPLSVSHVRGGLHAHTKDGDESTPEAVVDTRRGSNCGKVALNALVEHHANVLRAQYLAITEHSRDANPDAAVEGMTNWFLWMRKNDAPWIRDRFGKSPDELTDGEWEEIETGARRLAEQVTFYGDERLTERLERVKEVNQEDLPIVLLGGVEANLTPDGDFDTPMVAAGKFEIVNASIHPDLDTEGFKDIIKDPDAYTDLVVQGISHPETNVMAHIGFGCEPDFAEKLDWDRIAEAALRNGVALEINLRDMTKYLYRNTLDFDRFPADDTAYRRDFAKQLPSLIPLVSSPFIRNKLKPYVEQGLRFAINIDEHEVPFIEDPMQPEQGQDADQVYRQREIKNFRYWMSIKLAESYFNEVFREMGVEAEHIINTYPIDQLRSFLQKEAT